jgi:hypothetical protein
MLVEQIFDGYANHILEAEGRAMTSGDLTKSVVDALI